MFSTFSIRLYAASPHAYPMKAHLVLCCYLILQSLLYGCYLCRTTLTEQQFAQVCEILHTLYFLNRPVAWSQLHYLLEWDVVTHHTLQLLYLFSLGVDFQIFSSLLRAYPGKRAISGRFIKDGLIQYSLWHSTLTKDKWFDKFWIFRCEWCSGLAAGCFFKWLYFSLKLFDLLFKGFYELVDGDE